MKKGQIIQYKNWDYKIVAKMGNIIHVRPCKSNGRIRMFSPTISLIMENGTFRESNLFQS